MINARRKENQPLQNTPSHYMNALLRPENSILKSFPLLLLVQGHGSTHSALYYALPLQSVHFLQPSRLLFSAEEPVFLFEKLIDSAVVDGMDR